MTTHWISAERVFDGVNLLSEQVVKITDGHVVALASLRDTAPHLITHHYTGILMPGFFDIQVNGGGGVLLNTSPNPAALETIATAHRRFGTVAIMPTVISDEPDVLEAAVSAVMNAQKDIGIMGIHIEGPHISLARRGTHAKSAIRPLDDATFAQVKQLRDHDIPTLITLAPEACTSEQITTLRDMGCIVSIGHTDATAAQTQDALAAGATGFTHLFNAMSQMQSRAPGVTGAAITSTAWCGIIADGIHVDPMMLTLAIRARPAENRMILVSDAMPTVGGPPQFDLYGQAIHLKDGRLINANGDLAGAHLTMLDALNNLVSYGVELSEALRMCRHNPAQFLGLWGDMQLIGRKVSDLINLDHDLNLIHREIGLSKE
jgi:N-acetylglucosamine-6-phosphate deacetylase